MSRFAYFIVILLAIALVAPNASAQDHHGNSALDAALLRAMRGVQLSGNEERQLPAGIVEVKVIDENNAPVVGQDVRVGVMKSDGQREEVRQKSNEQGVARFSELPGGSKQAYRVTVEHEGAVYGATPFRLEEGAGRALWIRRLPVAKEQRLLLQWYGQTLVEFVNERVRIVQESQLLNVGVRTVKLPDEGVKVNLPKGFLNFQGEKVMSDQRFLQKEDGFVIKGSFPPGRVRLRWSYDLPATSSDMALNLDIPFNTIRYRLLTRKIPGVGMIATGFPPAEPFEYSGKKYIVSEISRSPDDTKLESVHLTIQNIPGPSQRRIWAIGIAALLALFIVIFSRQRKMNIDLSAHKNRLLDEIRSLDADAQTGEIGPKFHAKERKERLVRLAMLLERESANKG